MFSDHLRKIDEAPHKMLLLVAAGLVMVCQLVAMALVAGEQVQKAQMRGDSQTSRQVAVASCVESSRGVAVKECFRLARPELEVQQETRQTNNSMHQSVASEAVEIGTVAAPELRSMQSFIPAFFAAR